MFLYFGVFVITEYIDIGQRINENFFDLVNNLSVSLLYTVTFYKTFIIRSTAMSKIVEQIRTIEKTILHGDDESVKHIYRYHVKWNDKLSKAFIIIVFFTLAPFFINPLIVLFTSEEVRNGTVDKPLPFSSYLPFDKNYYYGTSFTLHFFAGVMGGFLTGTTDIFYWALMIFAIGQIKILQYKFKNLGKHALALMDKSKMSSDEAVNHCMKKCIILHQIIINYVTDVDDLMKPLMLMDFAICSMLISVVGIQVIVSGFGIAQVSSLQYLSSIMGQLFLFYWHANEIILESLDVSIAIWEGQVYSYPLNVQKSLQFVMLRAQKPLTLNVGPFYAMSTTTALSVLQAAYSYVALMRQAYS